MHRIALLMGKEATMVVAYLAEMSIFCTSNGGGRVTLTGLVILLIVLAPLLLGLGIEVCHHWTFLARLAFTLIGLAAFGFHPYPSLPTAAWYNRVTWGLWQNRAKKLMLKLIFI
jgi:hypothetical protein